MSSDSNSITVKLSSGGTKIVLYSPSTVIAVSKTGSASDLTTGQDVTVTGTANSDGSITASQDPGGDSAQAWWRQRRSARR